ncbi:C45 family peptidase [Erwinia sp. SLM-02]|uniref:C45 family peptidase n=1 Tax=Erwinia sp. SLM-02 TaxID=3020057 RepID=UPI003080DF85
MKHITLSGDNYQIGHQLGEQGSDAYRNEVRATALWGHTSALKNSSLLQTMQQQVQARFPLLWQELRGLADGLQAPFDEVFAWNCRGDLLPSTSDGCTTVTGFTDAGEPLIAHNEDGFPQLRKHCGMVTVRPEQGLAFTSFFYPGSICGHTVAVNERGLVNTVNNIRASERPAGMPRQILARAALDAATIDEAVTVLTSEPRGGAFHHSLAQCGDERIVSVEATGTAQHVQINHQRYGHANHLIHPEMAAVPQIVTGSSASRQQRLQQWLAEGEDKALNPDQALAILNDEQHADLPILRRDPADPDEENTLATAIFVIGATRVSWTLFTEDRQHACLSGQQP